VFLFICVNVYSVSFFFLFCSFYAFLLFTLPCLWAKLPGSNKCMYVCKVRGDQIQVVPVISRLGGDASHGSHGAVAPVVDSRAARTRVYAVDWRCVC